MKKPKISIITVCYNVEKTIQKTLDSIFNQSYPNIEIVIVDGQSTDGTLAIIEKHKDSIHQFTSEKDKGIFDAMNKGISMATGEYIWFIHADDQIYEDDTLEKAFLNHNDEDFVYGKAMLISEQGLERPLDDRKKHPSADELSWQSLKSGMIICHQAMIVKRSIAPTYDLTYHLVGDLDWAIRILKNTSSVRDTGQFLCRFVEGGTSTQHRRASLQQRFSILNKHFGLFSTIWQHVGILTAAIKRRSIR